MRPNSSPRIPAPSSASQGDKDSIGLREIAVGGAVTTLNEARHGKSAGSPSTKQLLKRNGSATDQGQITAAQGGLGALVSPDMHHSAVIHAQVGKASLASRNAFTLDLYGDQLVRLVVNDKLIAKMTDVQGRPLSAYVTRPGPLHAQEVLITTATARAALDNVVNTGQVTQANVFRQQAGHIVLSSGSDINVSASKAPVKVVGNGHAITRDPNQLVITSKLKTPKLSRPKLQPTVPDCTVMALICPSPNPALARPVAEVPVSDPPRGGAPSNPGRMPPPSAGPPPPDLGAEQPGLGIAHGSSDSVGWTATAGTASFADFGRGAPSGASSDIFSSAQGRSLVQASTPGADQQYFQLSAADYVVIRAARGQHK